VPSLFESNSPRSTIASKKNVARTSLILASLLRSWAVIVPPCRNSKLPATIVKETCSILLKSDVGVDVGPGVGLGVDVGVVDVGVVDVGVVDVGVVDVGVVDVGVVDVGVVDVGVVDVGVGVGVSVVVGFIATSIACAVAPTSSHNGAISAWISRSTSALVIGVGPAAVGSGTDFDAKSATSIWLATASATISLNSWRETWSLNWTNASSTLALTDSSMNARTSCGSIGAG